MMKGIQEHGTGDYYFIESGEDVSRLVNLGFSSKYNTTILKHIGTHINSVLLTQFQVFFLRLEMMLYSKSVARMVEYFGRFMLTLILLRVLNWET